MQSLKATVFMALAAWAPVGAANVVIKGITVAPGTVGLNEPATITVSGHVNRVDMGQVNCTGVEIYFGDAPKSASTDPNKPDTAYVRLQPTSLGPFTIAVAHQYTKVTTYNVIASSAQLYNGKWYHCGATGKQATITVLGNTLQSIKPMAPAVVNQQTTVTVSGVGSCSQDVAVNWGDGTTTTIAGPIDLKHGAMASHTYSSTGTHTITARGRGCEGVATTSLAVALLAKRGQALDNFFLQKLRDRLDRFTKLSPPPPPPPSSEPPCASCDGLLKQIAVLDQSGHALQAQSLDLLKDLNIDHSKGNGAAYLPVIDSLVEQFDGYFLLRTQLLKQYGRALRQAAKEQEQQQQ